MKISKSTTFRDSSHFKDYGYEVKPSVFSLGEIENFRSKVYEQYEIDRSLGLTLNEGANSKSNLRLADGCLLSKPKLYEILIDPRVIRFARDILGSEQIIYWGDSSYQIGDGNRGFHRDCVDRKEFSGPDWRSPYTLIRVGIYLQDHSKHSGGLRVKPGTHESVTASPVFVNSKPGDLVAWSLKLLHSGNAVRFRWFPKLCIKDTELENRVPSFLKKEQERERIALFITFGLESPHLYRFISEYQLKRSETVRSLKASVWNQHILEFAEQRGLDVRVLLPEYQLKS